MHLCSMIYYFTPFALNKDLGTAYNHYMSLLPHDNDYACFVDADVMWLTDDFGKQISDILKANPDVGMFTCLTNRVGNKQQCHNKIISSNPNLNYHREIALSLQKEKYDQVKELKRIISGHVMIIQKKIWFSNKFQPGMLGVDNKISRLLIDKGYKVLLMEGVYVMHYYRLNEGRDYKDHLL